LFSFWQRAKLKPAQMLQPLCLLFILAGCTARPPLNTTIETPAHTFKLPISTNTPVETPLAVSRPDLTRKCPQFLQSVDSLADNNYGKILFDRDSTTDILYNKLGNPYLYTLNKNKKEWIPNGTDFSVSNDRTLYAYRLSSENKLIISDSNGIILTISSTPDEGVGNWVNNGILFYDRDNGLYFFNPFKNERKFLRESFPHRYIRQETYLEGIYEKIYYDPSLTNAFYYAKDSLTNSYYFSIWNVSANKEIVRVPQYGVADSFPAEWSLDGKQIIVFAWSIANEKQTALLDIHTDGTIETLLSNAKYPPMFALSPDSKNLALWLYDVVQDSFNLSVLDMRSKTITDYCINSKFLPDIAPIWSPDSQTLVAYLSDGNNSMAILIDTKKNFAIQIAENAKPVGWLKLK